jgi:hypothetical protein
MLRLKTIGEAGTTGARKTGNRALTGILAAGLLMAGAVQGWAQGANHIVEDRAGGSGDL